MIQVYSQVWKENQEDYLNTNTAYGWAYYFWAHLLTACMVEPNKVREAVLQAVCHALLYRQRIIGGDRLSDNECILSSKPEWCNYLVTFKPDPTILDQVVEFYK